MKVALIVCDHVKNEFTEEHGDYPMMFRRLLPEIEMDDWYGCDGELPEVEAYDQFIYTGSKHSVYEDIQWIRDLTSFTQKVCDQNKKLVGICFGHQMIAHALGGKVKKSDQGYLIGVHQFKVKQQMAFNNQKLTSFNALMLCQDQVVELPPGSKVLANSPQCPIGMFTVGSRILGIQGHPEFTKAYNQAVFESRPDKIDQGRMIEAKESFIKEADANLLSTLITSFFIT